MVMQILYYADVAAPHPATGRHIWTPNHMRCNECVWLVPGTWEQELD
jgi:hypothetical protein